MLNQEVYFGYEPGFDQIFGQYCRIKSGLDCTMKILNWIRIGKISDPFNTSASKIER